jgi:hypothetical protein
MSKKNNQNALSKPKQAKSARKGKRNNRQPSENPARMRDVSVPFDEYVADIDGSVAFATTAYRVNPGLAATFPWLSQQAVSWERYKFLELEAYYEPVVSAYATNGQSGKIIIGIDYDAGDSPPTDKRHAMDSHPVQSAMPYESMAIRANPKQLAASMNEHCIRSAALPLGRDVSTFDACVLNVSTEGCAASSVIGELHIRGRVVFYTQVYETMPTIPNLRVAQWNTGSTSTLTTSGTVDISEEIINLDHDGPTNSSGTITLPAGLWLVMAELTFSVSADAAVALSLYVDGVTPSLPCKSTVNVSSSDTGIATSLTRPVESDGTTTVEVHLVHAQNTSFTVDQNRLTCLLL